MKFTVDDAGLERLLSDMGAAAFAREVGEQVAKEWERNDPRSRPGGHKPPELSVEMDREHGVAVANVTTPDPFWHIIEYGSVNNRPYRPATRAAASVGLDFKDTRK